MQESSTLLISRNGLPSFCSQQHCERAFQTKVKARRRSEEHTSELQSQSNLVCRLLLEKKKTSRQSTRDQVSAQNEILAYQQKESPARVASLMENTNLYKQQQVSEIMRQMLTQAQTAGQYFTNAQIKEMTRKVSAEVDLVHQQTQNQRYGSSFFFYSSEDHRNLLSYPTPGVAD